MDITSFIKINGLFDNIDTILSDLVIDGEIEDFTTVEESEKLESLAKEAIKELVETSCLDEDGEVDDDIDFREFEDSKRFFILEKIQEYQNNN